MHKDKKALTSLLMLLFFVASVGAQTIKKQWEADSISTSEILALQSEFGNNKLLLKEYEVPILLALSYYPELKDTPIVFRLKKTKTPLTSKPAAWGLMQAAKKRTYYITISEQTTSYLEPILFKNLSFNAKIGVVGHELAHIVQYRRNGFGKMMRIISSEIFSKKKVDQFEYQTDLRCIEHGLGYQLLAWSHYVREKLRRENWLGAHNSTTASNRERYMNPETILETMSALPLYNPNDKQ